MNTGYNTKVFMAVDPPPTLEEVLFRSVCENPSEPIHKLVLADHLLELGRDVEAEAWRLLGINGWYPSYETGGGLAHHYWWNASAFGASYTKDRPWSLLPAPWHDELMDETVNPDRGCRGFHSYENAFNAAIAAFVRLTPEDRQRCHDEGG